MSPHHDTTKTHRPTRKSSHALARRIRTGHDSRAARAAAAAGAPRVEPLESRTLLSTYYVSPAGSDTSAGTSDAAAFKTLQKAADRAVSPGDVVVVRAGTYNAGFNLYGKSGFFRGAGAG